MYLSVLSVVGLVPVLVSAAPQPVDDTLRYTSAFRLAQDVKLPEGKPVPQLLKDNPDNFFWPAIVDTEGSKSKFVSPANQSGGIVDPQSGNWFGTGLFGYEKCSEPPFSKKKIDDAYADMWYLTNVEGVYEEIDWDSAAAFEYLGPPASTLHFREQIQRMLKMAAGTSNTWLSPRVTWIHVRCDDPLLKCRCEKSGSGKLVAYTTQRDEKGYTQMNFCPPFFEKRRLRTEAIDYGKSLPYPENLDANSYDNTARVFLHELLHADYFMENDGSNHVYDLSMDLLPGPDGKVDATVDVYGPMMTKIMARFQPDDKTEGNRAGYYVEKNSDNMAWFATVKYVEEKIGIYPHLPIVYRQIDGPPFKRIGLAAIYNDTNGLSFDLGTDIGSAGTQSDGCTSSSNSDGGPNNPPKLTITGMAGDDLYSKEYLDQRVKWLKDLEGLPATTPTSSAGPSKPICDGNKVGGDCVTNVLPSAAPFSGAQAPSCAKADGSEGSAARLNKVKVSDGAFRYCDQLKKDKVKLGKDGTNPNPGVFAKEAENGHDMVLTVTYDESACPKDKKTDFLDFTTYDQKKCWDGFAGTLGLICAQDESFPKYNKDFTYMGGVWATDCALWSLQTRPHKD